VGKSGGGIIRRFSQIIGDYFLGGVDIASLYATDGFYLTRMETDYTDYADGKQVI
jgi:hypothetical protein